MNWSDIDLIRNHNYIFGKKAETIRYAERRNRNPKYRMKKWTCIFVAYVMSATIVIGLILALLEVL